MFATDFDCPLTLRTLPLMARGPSYQDTTSAGSYSGLPVWHDLGDSVIPSYAHLDTKKIEVKEHPLARFFGVWEGDDAEEVYALIKNSRSTF